MVFLKKMGLKSRSNFRNIEKMEAEERKFQETTMQNAHLGEF